VIGLPPHLSDLGDIREGCPVESIVRFMPRSGKEVGDERDDGVCWSRSRAKLGGA
jgi:hypothetical protein